MTALLMILNPDISTHIPINSKDYFYENIYIKSFFPFISGYYIVSYIYMIERICIAYKRNDEIL